MSTEHDSEGRRALLKALGVGVGYVAARAILPLAWSAPVVAGMSLPAHAAASGANNANNSKATTNDSLTCADSTPPTGSVEDSAVTITSKVTKISDGLHKVTLDIKLPETLVVSPQPYVLCEIANGEQGIATMALPSKSTALSNGAKQELRRGPGTYKYQVRWPGGHSAWVEVEAK